MQISPNDRTIAKKIIQSEFFNYIPLQHGRNLFDMIWNLSEYITNQEIIQFSYSRQDGKNSKKTIKPVSIMFNEFYFYLIGFTDSVDYPIIFRIDRIDKLTSNGDKFYVPYKNKFSDGEFRKRILFMYGGELKRIKFEYSSVPEAMLDKVPTAKVISQNKNTYTIEAETYGKGLEMWLNSQGKQVTIKTENIDKKFQNITLTL